MPKVFYLYIVTGTVATAVSCLGLKPAMAMVFVSMVLIGYAGMSTNLKNKDYGDLVIPSSKGMSRSITGKSLISAKLGLIFLFSPLMAMAFGVLRELV